MITLMITWLKSQFKWLAVVLVAQIGNNIIELVLPFVIAEFIDNALMPRDYNIIWLYCCVFGLFVIMAILVGYFSSVISTKMISSVVAQTEQNLLQHIATYPYSFFCNYESGYLASRINRDVGDLIMFSVGSCMMIIAGVCSIIGSLTYLLFIDIVYFFIFLMMIVVYVIFYQIIKGRLEKLSFETREYESQFFNIIVKVISNIRPIKIHNIYKIYGDRLNAKFYQWIRVNVSREKLSYWFASSRDIASKIFILINFSYGGIQVIGGNLAIGQFVAINTYFVMALSGASSFLNLAQNYQNAKSAYQRIELLQETLPEKNGDSNLKDKLQKVEIVNMSYSVNGHEVFNSFSVTFVIDKIYAICGENGSGKTTLINLLVGLIHPDKGNIFYNDIPLPYYDIKKLRKDVIAYSDQDAFICEELVSNNALNNVLATRFTLDLDKIKDMKQLSNNLSGGEKQKLLHLQFLHPSKQLLILDEPTSSMDKEDSKKLWQYLEEIKKNRIIIVITHKKEELDCADKVIKINKLS